MVMTATDSASGGNRTEKTKSSAVQAAIGPRYLVVLLTASIATVAAFFCLLLALERTGHLPPPPIANNICIDEKLAFLRQHPPEVPNVLVIGSSVAWRHFDGAAVVAAAPGTRPLNGGFCGLRANQTVFVANWLLDRLPTVRDVIMIASPQDFETCRMHPAALFDKEGADSFVFANAWRWSFYFRYFDPASLVRNMQRVAAMRANIDPINSLVFTRFGDGPLDTTASKATLEYGEVRGFDPSCFIALQSLARRLASEDRRLVVVNTPLHPEWKRRYDPQGTLLRSLEGNVLAALVGTNGHYWDGDSVAPMEAQAFIDGIHLRWSAVRVFSEALARALRLSSFSAGLAPDQAAAPSARDAQSDWPEPTGIGSARRIDDLDRDMDHIRHVERAEGRNP